MYACMYVYINAPTTCVPHISAQAGTGRANSLGMGRPASVALGRARHRGAMPVSAPARELDHAGARWVPLPIGGDLDSERAGAVLGRYNHACIAVPHAAWATELGRDADTDVSVVNVGGNDARHVPMAHGVDIRFSLV